LLLAGIGTAGLVAEHQSNVVKNSRAGFSSGKISNASPRVYSKVTAGKVNVTAKGVGWGLTIWSVYNTESQFRNGEINGDRRSFNHMNNGIATIFPIAGLPISAGDYLGQKYSNEIVKDFSEPGGILFEGTKTLVEFLGFPSGPNKLK
jgi:hypothetical protein